MVSATVPAHRHFTGVPGRTWKVRVQSMLLVDGGYLLADLLVIPPPARGKLPSTAHLVVEVSQTSQARDREKARDYAAADVTEYWIVDLPGRSVSVHRSPLAGAYQEVTTFADGAEVRPLLSDAPAVDVTALLG
jgi:Uma2 family endonuclease